MARVYGTLGQGEVYTGFWFGNLRERVHSEDIGIDGKIILKWILNWMGRDGLGEERDKWRAVLYTVMRIWFHRIWGISCLVEKLLTWQEWLCCV